MKGRYIMKKKCKLLIVTILLIPLTYLSIINVKASNNALYGGIVSTNGTTLNIRQSPSTTSKIITKVNDNSYLSLISQNGSWWYVMYSNNSYGYASANYINKLAGSYNQIVKTSGGNLNVRSYASTSASIITSLPNQTNVVVLSQTNGFSKILYNGNKIGYVSTSYLGTKETAKYTTKTLNVPSYKQFDSRWAKVSIGNSGSTMKQIGCTTTALAMTESYRSNKTVTPLDMRNKLSYTSGGALYWPSVYTQYYGSDYLAKLYTLIKQGKPAIISFKKTNGSSHFVVVTGYSGNTNTLSATNFLINDPGSSSRTRLSEVIQSYPIYNKINYYNV